MMDPPRSRSLRKDFGVFFDLGFLLTLLVIGCLSAVGAYVLVSAANHYGIPVSEYWR